MNEQNEKQAIEEIAKVIEVTEQIARDAHCGLPSPTMYAKDLYWHGYRKQSEGEWMTYHCTNGGKSKRGRTIIYKTYTCGACGKSNGRHKTPFCHNCGAKMKGTWNE